MLSLIPATEDDLPLLSELAADPEVEPFITFGAAEEERMRSLLDAPGPGPGSDALLRIESEAGETLGALGLVVVNPRSRICELTRLMVRPDRRRAGVAGAAIELACAQSLIDQRMHRIQAECLGDNSAAHRLFERAGFTREGMRRRAYWRRGGWLDGIMFGLLAEEFSTEESRAGAERSFLTPRVGSAPILRK